MDGDQKRSGITDHEFVPHAAGADVCQHYVDWTASLGGVPCGRPASEHRAVEAPAATGHAFTRPHPFHAANKCGYYFGGNVDDPDSYCNLLEQDSEHNVAPPKPEPPHEQERINALFDNFNWLRTNGWQEAIHAPRDGTEFECIEVGSIGIHRASWCDGFLIDGDWPTRFILWRPLR